MSKKTKKEKIIANYRKKLKLLQTQTYIQPSPSLPQIQTAKKIVEEYKSTETDLSLKKYFFSDLRKSIVLIAAILSLEIIFYFARIK